MKKWRGVAAGTKERGGRRALKKKYRDTNHNSTLLLVHASGRQVQLGRREACKGHNVLLI
jgi:hypothetical protein